MKVKRAVVEDAEVLSQLNVHAQRAHAEMLPDVFKQPGPGTFSAADARAILTHAENLVFIAMIDDEPVGYAYAEVRRRHEDAYRYAAAEVYVHHLSVAPDFRRMGVGRALLDAVNNAADDLSIARVGLDVWSVNGVARAFSSDCGFTAYNERMTLVRPTAPAEKSDKAASR